MDSNRQNLFNLYREAAMIGCPEPISTGTCANLLKFDTNFPDYPAFYDNFFQDYKGTEKLRLKLVTLPNIPKTNEKEFYEKYACDLVKRSNFDQSKWELAATEFCKVPEPPKKLTQVEIIQQYHDNGIHPFTKGKVVALKNKPGSGYYEKQGTSRGMEGTFQFYAPNKEGETHYGFYINGENEFNGITKVTNVIHESKLRRKNLSEKYDKDSKVLHLLKEISRINKEKKNLITENLSPAQAKSELNKIQSNYFTIDFLDYIEVENYTRQIISLLNRNYKGNIFGWFKRALELAALIIPGVSGEDDDTRKKTERYNGLIKSLESVNNVEGFYEPSDEETDSGNYSRAIPQSIKGLIKPNYSVWRPKSLTSATGEASTYRTKTQDAQSCQADLNQLYDEAIGGFRNQENYCTTQTFIDRKNYINGCYNKGFFQKTSMLFTGDEKLFYEKYSDLYRGVVVINRRNKRNADQRPLPKECALKN